MADSLKIFAVIAVLFILLLTGQIAFSQPRDHWNNIITVREINFETRAIAYCENSSGNDRIFLVFRVDSEVDSFSVTSFDRDTGDIYSVGSYTAAYIGYTGTGVPMAAACEGNYLYVATDKGYVFKIPADTYGLGSQVELYQVKVPSGQPLNITRIKYKPGYGFLITGFDASSYGYSIIVDGVPGDTYFALRFRWVEALLGLDAEIFYDPDSELPYLYTLLGSKVGSLYLDVYNIKEGSNLTTYRFTKELWASSYLPGLTVNANTRLLTVVMPIKAPDNSTYARVFTLRLVNDPAVYVEYRLPNSGDQLIGLNVALADNDKIYVVGSLKKGTGNYELFMLEARNDLTPLRLLSYYGYKNELAVRASQSIIRDYIYIGGTTDSFSDTTGFTSAMVFLASPAQNGGDEAYVWEGDFPIYSNPEKGLYVGSLDAPTVASPGDPLVTVRDVVHEKVTSDVGVGFVNRFSPDGTAPKNYIGLDATDPVPVPEPVLAVAGVLAGVLVVLVARSRALRA